jgi:small-conductance mechanosensitive channel
MLEVWKEITHERYLVWAFGAIRVIALIAGGYILTVLAKRMLRGVRKSAVSLMIKRGDTLDLELEKRATTVVSVIRTPVLLGIWAAVVLAILDELNVKIGPLLAGMGLGFGALSVAVGLGAQTMIKDILGGIFLLMDNQIRVNDVAVINGTGGVVEEMNLRTTVLRAENGAVHIFPNGSITTLSNLTREYAYYVIEVEIDYEDDPDAVAGIIREVGAELRADETHGLSILSDVEVLGIDKLGATAVTMKARIKTAATKRWAVGREFNRRLFNRLAAAGISCGGPTNIVRMQEPRGQAV